MKFIAQINTPRIKELCKRHSHARFIDNQTAELIGNLDSLIQIANNIHAQEDCVFYKSEKDMKDLELNLVGLEVVMDLSEIIEYLTNTNPYLNEIEGGEWIIAGGENITTPKMIYTLDLSVLELSLHNLLEYRTEENKTIRSIENKRNDRNSAIVVAFFNHVEKIKAAILKGSFTDTFEACTVLKIYLVSKDKYLHFFVGDADLGLILNAICLKLTSACFDYLEVIETQHKELFTHKFKALQ